jgi:hypothetical protein
MDLIGEKCCLGKLQVYVWTDVKLWRTCLTWNFRRECTSNQTGPRCSKTKPNIRMLFVVQ